MPRAKNTLERFMGRPLVAEVGTAPIRRGRRTAVYISDAPESMEIAPKLCCFGASRPKGEREHVRARATAQFASRLGQRWPRVTSSLRSVSVAGGIVGGVDGPGAVGKAAGPCIDAELA